METRDFHIGDILTITTDRLLSPRGVGGVYDILGFMTGDEVYTHQIPRFMDECKPYLMKQHPQLEEIEVPEEGLDDKRTFNRWLRTQVKKYGETLPVKTLPKRRHKKRNTLVEALEMTRLSS